ncbi:MAG: formylglycine-generating enzyme family protein [Phycisphaerae bacterium]|nr:formylglycine-generating enzyme family protein [Saprospiraceae bacterium]
MNKFALILTLCAFTASSAMAQDDGILLPSQKGKGKGTLPTRGVISPSTSRAPVESVFLTFRITVDLEGKIFAGNKEKAGLDIKKGEPLEIPLYNDNCTLFFVGPDGFTYKEQLNFSPNLRGTTAERLLNLEKLYQIFLKKQAKRTVEERILDDIFQNMQPIESEDALIPPFEISRFEVTVGQFALFAKDSKSKHDAADMDSAYIISLPSGERGFRMNIDWRYNATGSLRPVSEYDHPVANVSWYEANAFCEWLSHNDPIYQYRLPTAKEWEYVASCGNYYKYPWGDDPNFSFGDSLTANIADVALKARIPKRKESISPVNDNFPFTSPGGAFYSPCFDLYDLGGNVAEWVQDDRYREVGGRQIHEKQIKGGSFFTPPGDKFLVQSKDFWAPQKRHCGIGFRVVREPK